MILSFHFVGRLLSIDSQKGIDISIPYHSGLDQVNCFFAPFYSDEPVTMGSFIGSVSQGGPVNFYNAKINIHGNGTHTECVGHISPNRESLDSVLQDNIFTCSVMSVYPTKRDNGDRVIEKHTLEALWSDENSTCDSLIIRTLPNDHQKKSQKYSGSNPIYFDPEAMQFIVDKQIKHLLVDIPSVDREEDGGQLLSHRCFWMDGRAKYCTITELIFVPNSVLDGIYVLYLQTASIKSDAVPSKPILFRLES